ncbi:MAG: substrate-binding periplasmic protein [Candidatus Methylomirabilia bacterium]
MRHAGISVGVAVALAILMGSPAFARALVLSTDDTAPIATVDHTGICDRIMTEAFKRLGLELEIVNRPSERALIDADAGISDGTYTRIEGMEKLYPNLIRVAEEIASFEFVGFTRGAAFKTEGWESLRPYDVAIVTGWKILETNITGAKSLTKVRNEKLLFGLLAAGRADVVVYARLPGRVVARQLGLRGIAELEPPLAVKSMYPYLNKRHATLVPRLEQVLREMKQDATFRKITEDALRTRGAGD